MVRQAARPAGVCGRRSLPGPLPKGTLNNTQVNKRNPILASRPDTRSRVSVVALPRSYNVLVDVRLAVVRRHEGTEPAEGEGVAEHHLHIHPF